MKNLTDPTAPGSVRNDFRDCLEELDYCVDVVAGFISLGMRLTNDSDALSTPRQGVPSALLDLSLGIVALSRRVTRSCPADPTTQGRLAQAATAELRGLLF
jgi:hypothetical protein